MKQEEYVKTIVYNDRMINVGHDDAGQTYFIEYLENGKLEEECVGSYITDYESYIEYRFGKPEINCPIYNDVVVTDTECCTNQTKAFCCKCIKHLSRVEYEAWQRRVEDLNKWIKSNCSGDVTSNEKT